MCSVSQAQNVSFISDPIVKITECSRNPLNSKDKGLEEEQAKREIRKREKETGREGDMKLLK